ncbi:helix-turn-helix domain-containing protein [Fulvivirga maritima]|uniref:helix-turn-helix domain-containing protein n=1 Tax=Fulvivirga maritima TaxID=2904247 RepID=UPI001F26E454|nr:helix-turn-helix domain-containing protein [Fulvivirga maritima]UII27522.1 helix-turn-helix domain-containing protein [Fulvivirga maritima]
MSEWKSNNIKEYQFNEMQQMRGKKPSTKGLHILQEHNKKGEDAGFMFPFRTDHHVVILLLSGKVKVQLNLTTFLLEPHDLILISGRMVTQSIDFLEDATAIIIAFTKEYALENAQKTQALESFQLLRTTISKKVSLDARELENFMALTTYLNNKIQNEQEEHIDAKMVHAFNLLSFELSGLYEKHHPSISIDLSRKEELSASFIKLLGKHFREERSVSFYANALHVTSGHLTKTLKQVSGKSTRQLIDEAVILDAKILLAKRALTVAQISAALNFNDQSFFGKFFKKETGLSPSAYRQLLSQSEA